MQQRKQIGKIQKVSFGFGGYQEAMIGLSLTFGSDKESWGVQTFHGAWGIDRSDYCKWTEEDRLKQLGETCMKLRDLMRDAKVQTVDDLEGVPVEVTFDGNMLKDYRILTEVL